MRIKEVFNIGAEKYDAARKQLIPCYEEFYSTALKVIPFSKNKELKILDLGAGTGLLTSLIIELYPKAEITLYDISEEMLEKAKLRFKNSSNIKYRVTNYSTESIEGKFDLVVSALSIHHLSDTEKQKLFNNIYLSLNDNGMFINADQCLGDNEYIDRIYKQNWLKEVKENNVTPESLSAATERMKEDKMSTLSDQLKWMEKSGFSNINCWYKNYSFIVYSGCKYITGVPSAI